MKKEQFKDFIEEVRTANPLEEVITELYRPMENHMVVCPFHDDNNPSLSVHPNGQYFNCFGRNCGARGDVFSFVMRFKKRTFMEALQYLANRKNILPPNNCDFKYEGEARDVYDALAEAATIYISEMTPEIAGMLDELGIRRDIITDVSIGYCSGITLSKRKFKSDIETLLFDPRYNWTKLNRRNLLN